MIKTAFVFPGQGSQSVGMLSDFLPQYSLIPDAFFEASDAVGYDVWDLIQNGPEEKLNQTEHTQVAMLTADVAIFRLLKQQGLAQVDMMAGHSLGEYAALVCAGSLSLAQAAVLVAKRGQLMQNAVPLGLGSMAAIVGLEDQQVKALCEEASDAIYKVSPANYNALGQVVIAGHTVAVEKAIILANNLEARLAKIIPVSVPCHCSLLQDAAENFYDSLVATEFKKPQLPVVSNVDLSVYQTAEDIRNKLKKQLYSPVRWVETIQLFATQGAERLIECGPGKVLAGLIKRIDKSLEVISVYDNKSFKQLLESLHCNV